MNEIKTAKDFISNSEHKPNFQITSTDGKEYWISRAIAVFAAVVCKKDDDLYILINKRGEGCPDYNNMWNIPCGYLDWGETCEQACAREIYEECGIKISSDMFKLFAVESNPQKDLRQNVTLRYIAHVPNDFMRISLSDEHSEKNEIKDIRWIKFNEADKYQWAFNHKDLVSEVYDIVKNF